MKNHEMRTILKQAYPSKRWQLKVDKMSDKQVAAVYLRLQKQKKPDKI